MKIPFVDLKAQYRRYQKEIDQAVQSVIDETAFIRSHYVSEFEEQFASAYGVKHCIGVGNGTDALCITLKMLGIGTEDEVITVTNSWIATSEAISATGAKVVFADIEERFYNLDPAQIEAKITPKTKAVLPVHIYGLPADIGTIKEICDEHDLLLVEDCAQAHFAKFSGQNVGKFGKAAAFSFYPGKNLGAYGDAGAIITDDDELADKIRMFGNHGALKKHTHLIEGCNSRLDGLQAAILSVKLPHLREWNRARADRAAVYSRLLADCENIKTPDIRDNCEHVFHIYGIVAEQRDQLQEHLKEQGIITAIHYPTPLPFMPAYAHLGHQPEDFPVTSGIRDKLLSLPMFPELTDEQIHYVVDQIKDFYAS